MAIDTSSLREGINDAAAAVLNAFDFVPYSVSVGALAISAFLVAGRLFQGLRVDGPTAATVVNLGGGMVSAAVIYATTSGLLGSDIEQFGLKEKPFMRPAFGQAAAKLEKEMKTFDTSRLAL
jgi:hypothetical protein